MNKILYVSDMAIIFSVSEEVIRGRLRRDLKSGEEGNRLPKCIKMGNRLAWVDSTVNEWILSKSK